MRIGQINAVRRSTTGPSIYAALYMARRYGLWATRFRYALMHTPPPASPPCCLHSLGGVTVQGLGWGSYLAKLTFLSTVFQYMYGTSLGWDSF